MQQGGSQYGVPPPPEMAPFSPTGTGAVRAHVLGISGPDHLHQQQQAQQLAEAASPISSRPPPTPVGRLSNFDELAPAASGNFQDEDALAAGEEVERGVPGNRWPRQETLALLKIRSEMDAAFRDATLKGPLWEDVSRKLAELGYTRNAKKCKEKFENVHKYYKRTKEGRAGRQDGKSYRFFTQLEALHSGSGTTASTNTLATVGVAATATVTTSPNPTSSAPIGFTVAGSAGRMQPTPLASAAPSISAPRVVPDLAGGHVSGMPGSAAGISFSSNTSSSAYSDSDDEGTEEGQPAETRKRKRRGASEGSGGAGGSRKMMAFFEGLMKQVMERQEAMQQRFLETIEKREQDRMIREEAWKRQEMARVAKEHEAMAHERAFSASRDAAIIGFLQKITGQTVQLPPPIASPPVPPPQVVPVPVPPQPPQPPLLQHPQHQQSPSTHQLQQQQQQQLQQTPPQHHPNPHHQGTEIVRAQTTSSEIVPFQDPQEIGMGVIMDPASSRWPKSEVLALINLRSGLESRYQEAGPKGPLWEEISAGMRRMGFNRNSKRCKEKWENINKYFKKVKESNKKRPEDAKTCPYFHQLDALYRKKVLGGGGGNPDPTNPHEIRSDVLTIIAPPPPQQQPLPTPQATSKNGNDNNKNGGNPDARSGEGAGVQVPTSNGGLPMSFFEEGNGGSAGAIKKPEGIVMEQQQPQLQQQHRQAMVEDYDKFEDPADSDNIDQDDEDDENEDDEDRKMDYKIQFQRQTVSGKPNSGGNPSAAATAAAAAAAAGSFLAMVQ